MNCVAECEYCRSVNVCIDSPNCNTTGHFCTKLKVESQHTDATQPILNF